jgi:hypothetical protein
MSEEKLSTEEQESVYKYLSQSESVPSPEEKHNVHTFLLKVATEDDTTKVGFLSQEEVGKPTYSERSLKDFAVISEKIINNPFLADIFKAEAENLTATSLSKEGFLVRQATTQTKQIADITKIKKENKGWFKSKKDKPEEQST